MSENFFDTRHGRLIKGDVFVLYPAPGMYKKGHVKLVRIHSLDLFGDHVADFKFDRQLVEDAELVMALHEFHREDGTTILYMMSQHDFENQFERIQLLRRGTTEEWWRKAIELLNSMLLLIDFETIYQNELSENRET